MAKGWTWLPAVIASERGVDAASLSLLPQLSLNSNLVGSFTPKRPEGRAPTNRQFLDVPESNGLRRKALQIHRLLGIIGTWLHANTTANYLALRLALSRRRTGPS
jgi:hypothetical protein